ncbi:MAG: DASS family sodium-coupled anion symporter [Alphaproteobacteria bacterium]|nr:DASS family sodium-coupled anion symporter [Alphaproteobacteria bacterium]
MSFISFISDSLSKSDVKFKKLSVIILIATVLCIILPNYTELSPEAVRMLVIFISTMVGIILEVCNPIVLLLLAVTFASLSHTINVQMGFSGFSNTVPWLLFVVLSLAKTISSSTLGLRLAYLFMKYFGGSVIGLSYSIILTEVLMGPLLPSNTARAASIGAPLVKSLSQYISCNIKNVSEKSIGAYLAFLYACSNAFISGMFLTAMLSNSLIVEAAPQFGLTVTWTSWFKYLALPYVVVLLITPFILQLICNPNVKNLSELKSLAAKNYDELGEITNKEKLIIFTFIGMLLFWILSEFLNIPIMTTALIGLCIFIFTGILNIKDILSSYGTFSSVMLLGLIISLVNCLIDCKVIEWFSGIISNSVGDLNKNIAFIVLTSIYYFAQYFFTSESSKIMALFVPFLSAGMAVGIDARILAITLASFSSASDILGSYVCPSALTLYASGYLTLKQWMSYGIIIAFAFLTIWYTYIWIFF